MRGNFLEIFPLKSHQLRTPSNRRRLNDERASKQASKNFGHCWQLADLDKPPNANWRTLDEASHWLEPSEPFEPSEPMFDSRRTSIGVFGGQIFNLTGSVESRTWRPRLSQLASAGELSPLAASWPWPRRRAVQNIVFAILYIIS